MTPQSVRAADGMIRAKVAGGGPCGYAPHFNVYPPYDEYIPVYSQGWYRRTGTYPNFIYRWEPKNVV